MFDRPRNCCSSKHAVKKQNFLKRKSPTVFFRQLRLLLSLHSTKMRFDPFQVCSKKTLVIFFLKQTHSKVKSVSLHLGGLFVSTPKPFPYVILTQKWWLAETRCQSLMINKVRAIVILICQMVGKLQ